MASVQLDPDAVGRGESLGMLARMVVEGYKVGEHRSPLHGFAIEFAQHREYTPGDDIRHLDWKVLGRSDRYYIKQYEQDTNFVAHMLLDGSESMDYGHDKVRKMDYAKALAACLAHVILHQRDAVALSVFNTKTRQHFARTDNPGRIHDLLHMLAKFEPGGGTAFGRALDDAAARSRMRGIAIVLSDLFGDEEEFKRGIEKLRFIGHEVIVFHVLDPHEIDFPLTGSVKFVGLEDGGELQTSPAGIRKSYLEEFGKFRTQMRHICERANCHYVLANTGTPLAETLSGYLAFRKKSAAR